MYKNNIMEKLTHSELMIISHSLGVDLYNAVMSNKLKDKKLPDIFYRNIYYITKDSHGYSDIKAMESKKLMAEFTPDFFHVTALGIKQFIVDFADICYYRKPEQRDEQYLANKINFYCDFYSYKLGDNPAHLVFNFYKEYFWDKIYVSHTINDIFNNFRKELKKLFPKNI